MANKNGWEDVTITPNLTTTSNSTPSTVVDDLDADFAAFTTQDDEDSVFVEKKKPTEKKSSTVVPDEGNDEGDTYEDEDSYVQEELQDNNSEVEQEDVDVVKPTNPNKDTTTKKPSRAQQRIEQLAKQVKSIAQRKDAEFLDKEAQYLDMINELQYRLDSQQKDLAGISVASADRNIQQARIKLKQAKENMDYDAELEAIEELTEAKQAKSRAEELAKKVPKDLDIEAPRKVDRTVLLGTRKRDEWIRSNQQLISHPEIANLVGVVARSVENEGYMPHDDEYYTEVNRRVNKRLENAGIEQRVIHFLDQFNMGNEDEVYEEDDDEPLVQQTPPQQQVVKRAVNPMQVSANKATPTKKNGGKARLSAEEVQAAQRLGIDPQGLLRQKAYAAKEQARNGWNSVYIPTRKQ